MKLIFTETELPQGSEAWAQWRSGLTLGGSEVAALMHASPYQNIEMLWEYKLGLRPPKEYSEAMRDGNKFEPLARAAYAQEYNVEVEQLCAIHPTIEYMRTSLDGITLDRTAALEVKCPKNEKNHLAHTKNGRIPHWRYPQIQHQIAVCNAHWGTERVDYVSFLVNKNDEGEVLSTDMKVIPVFANWEYIAELIRREEIFMGYLRREERPPHDLFREGKGLVVRARVPKVSNVSERIDWSDPAWD